MSVAWLAASAGILALYEVGVARLARRGVPWPEWRRGCWLGAVTLLALAGLPPLAGHAHSSVWAEALQFGILAFGAAPLGVMGAPAALLEALGIRPRRAPAPVTPGQGWLRLGVYLVVTVGWRVPPAVDAVAGGQPWLALEAVTLVAGSWVLWTALAGSPSRWALRQRPRRIALSALSAWSVWIFAYVVGFSPHAFYPAFARPGAVGSQEVAVGVLWATSAIAFVPVIFVNLVRFLNADQMAAEAETERYRARVLATRSERV